MFYSGFHLFQNLNHSNLDIFNLFSFEFQKKKKLLQQNQVINVSDGKKALLLNSFSYETGKTFSDRSYRNNKCVLYESVFTFADVSISPLLSKQLLLL